MLGGKYANVAEGNGFLDLGADCDQSLAQRSADSLSAALEKHSINRLDDAYVYMGRSQVALKDAAAARAAFMQLKTVPTISPRVLRIWGLYADTIDR